MDRSLGDDHRKTGADPGLDPNRRGKKINKRRIIIINVTLLLLSLALILCGWAVFDHVLPQEEVPLYEQSGAPSPAALTPSPSGSQAVSSQEPSPSASSEPEGIFIAEGMQKGELSYQSHDLNIQIKKIRQFDTNIAIAEVYTRDSGNFFSAFAHNKFGQAITELTTSMASDNGAILAISGDNYGGRTTGVIIRNGKLYRDKPYEELMAIYGDGVMKTFTRDQIDTQKMLSDGVWQTYSFGPGLMEDGKPIADFSDRTNVRRKNPRTAVGQIAPNHYIFLVTDGRTGDSSGLSMEELAQVFAEAGCTVAYNLDGGASSAMVFDGKLVNELLGGSQRSLSDILYVKDTP